MGCGARLNPRCMYDGSALSAESGRHLPRSKSSASGVAGVGRTV